MSRKQPTMNNYWLNIVVLIFNSFDGLDNNTKIEEIVKPSPIFVAS